MIIKARILLVSLRMSFDERINFNLNLNGRIRLHFINTSPTGKCIFEFNRIFFVDCDSLLNKDIHNF